MEGKALLFKYLGGVDAFPICLATKDPEEIIQACKWLDPTFGAINLEDISSPKSFYILDRLRQELTIPIWHDDQQGTAAVTLAGLMNALKLVGKTIEGARVVLVGAGAANLPVARLLFAAGFPPSNLLMVDSKGWAAGVTVNVNSKIILDTGELVPWSGFRGLGGIHVGRSGEKPESSVVSGLPPGTRRRIKVTIRVTGGTLSTVVTVEAD